MAYCCVPLCKSDGKRPIPGEKTTFHEIPVLQDIREKWLAATKRDDWSPNSTSNYSKVCSKHFHASDFLEGKRRRLKKDAVPSIFSDFPSYLQPKVTKERSVASIRKRTCAPVSAIPRKRVRREAEPPQEAGGTSTELHGEGTTDDLQASPRKECPNRNEGTESTDTEGRAEVFCKGNPPPLAAAVSTSDQSTQADIRNVRYTTSLEHRRLARKTRDMRKQIERLRSTVDSYKVELKKLHEDQDVETFRYIRSKAADNDTQAMFLMDQVRNFKKKSPRWSEDTLRHCIILRHLSTKSYEHIRSDGLLKLPSRNTLQNYIGRASGETGFSALVKTRLEAELQNLGNNQSRTCSLVIDEMQIKQKLQYNKQQDAFVGQVDYVPLNSDTKEPVLANSLLCFLLCGLSVSFRIPVAYFVTKGLKGDELSQLVLFVLEKVESIGFRVLRIVTDNHRVNVNAMKILCRGDLTHRIAHPADSQRALFLSFDYCHILKNLRSQFLDRDIGKDNEVSSSYLKRLYELQKEASIKAVKFLSRKHVYPNNIEKMNVKRAVQLFSPDVTAALKFLKGQAGHTCNPMYASSGPTILFMETLYRWFILHDTSNCTQYIHQRFPDVRHYDNSEDSRLEWLESTFTAYLSKLKEATKPTQFFTKETYEALLMTTHSTVACVRHLLQEEKFGFVLTRKFSSDAVESLFGALRRSQGCNDQMNVKSTLHALERILKTGIVSASQHSNVSHTVSSNSNIVVTNVAHQAPTTSPFNIPSEAEYILQRLSEPRQECLPSLQLSATTHVGGFIARVVVEKVHCENCCQLVLKAKSNQASQGLTMHQDRGGLLYPSDDLVYLLCILRQFAEAVLSSKPKPTRPLSTLLHFAVPAVSECPLLKCSANTKEHRHELVQLICTKFFRPLLTNHAFHVTDRNYAAKAFFRKPLSRKYLRLN
ncbi:uncharacterized protein LOC135393663 [Ornithodoros turicata]|uniref:uncharacterized protein LOC135393663 n=1 Tax=Ornithodoros turicata TaxID=34597 RepID=UPI003139E6F7